MSLELKTKWFVLYTKPNFEKKVDRQLKDMEIESYLPLHTVIRKWSDRKKKVDVPLFPGYIFMHGDEKSRFNALSVSGVVRSVMFKNEPATLKDDEIENIRRIIKSEKIIETAPNVLVGSKVRIVKGPLEGLEGLLTEIKGSKVFSLVLEKINSSILVDVPKDDVLLL